LNPIRGIERELLAKQLGFANVDEEPNKGN